jgi:probable selenium-dependent hydroxylase accessory protein YqeC
VDPGGRQGADRARGGGCAGLTRATLAEALGITTGDVVALVGGGGKTTAMFRLAREIVERGEPVLTTSTTHIFAEQIELAPASVRAADATRESVLAALDAHRHVLVIGDTDTTTGRAGGVSPDLFARLRVWCPRLCLLNEADGSRGRPFKAPARHEPAIPPETTLVVPVVGADVFGEPLDAEHVHRPELVQALSGAAPGTRVTPELVARVLAHRQGGCKNVPASARIVVLINKVETLADREPARETAERLVRESAIEAVVLAAASAEEPVLEVRRR